MEATGETVNLGMLDGPEVVFLAQVESHATIRTFFQPGRRRPAYALGIGRALLAFTSPIDVATLLGGQPLRALTQATITEIGRLQRELHKSRLRGWAINHEEFAQGIRCIGAPIVDEHGVAVAGISISSPTVRVGRGDIKRIAAQVVAAAGEIAGTLSGSKPEL